ncbi:MAG: nuclear transport factor 2 family protein [Candidatus Acidiferrales bacterium]
MRMKKVLASTALILMLAACSPAPPPAPPDTRAADAQAIRDEITTSSAASASKDYDKFFAFYDRDASVFAPDAPVVTGLPSIETTLKAAFADPNFSIDIQIAKVEVSRASDYGYAQGTFTQKATNPKTKKVEAREGKWVTVFKKETDGSWKAVSDIFNFSGPATPVKK